MSDDFALSLSDVTVVLGSYTALRGINFVLPEGGFLALLGPNGAGKSTLLKAALGLVPVTSGSISVLGGMAGAADPKQVGYIPQIKTLDRNFPALPIELVASGMKRRWPWRLSAEDRTMAREALKRCGMEDKAERPIHMLSGGELQRVYLARALVHHPRLLVLDEPATGMDRGGESDMFRLLDQARREFHATVLMITHDWEAARHHSTHVLLINREQVAFGAPAEVMTDRNLRLAYGHVGHGHGMELEIGDHHDHAH